MLKLLLPEMGMEMLEHHSTRSDWLKHVKPTRFVSMLVYLVTPLTTLIGAGEIGVLAVACHLAEPEYTCTV